MLYFPPMDFTSSIDWSFLNQFANSPFEAMWFFIIHGGFLVFIYVAWIIAKHEWLSWRATLAMQKKKFVVLVIHIPRLHEQTPRAVDNMFAFLAGAHATSSWKDTWIDGKGQDTISCEIISDEGQVQFVIRCVTSLRDLVEAAIYSQYPDAEIVESEDYAKKVPHHFPDEEWDMWCTEMIPVKSDVYPLKTYPFFEDKVSGEFKDPLAVMLESMSRLGPGEQSWFQIVLTPIGQAEFSKKADEAVKKLKGEEKPHKKGMLEHIAELPIHAILMVVEALVGGGDHDHKPAKKEGGTPKIQSMTEGEKQIIAGIEMKASKIVYKCKIRYAYVAKKAVMTKTRAVQPFIGAIKQFNTNNMQSLKPESKHVGVNGALWFFKDSRNNMRKTHFIHAYASRSNYAGTNNFHMNTEELASLWHFPVSVQVKAPQLKRTEAKKTEPPNNLPFG